MPNDTSIKFYTSGADYDIFSNVTDIGFKINLNREVYTPPSSEAVYQGVKGLSADNQDSNSRKLGEAFLQGDHGYGKDLQRIGRHFDNKKFLREQSSNLDESALEENNYPKETFSEKVMYEILLCKFTQHPSLLKALLDTGDREITENTQQANYDDSFWGNGKQGNGRNALGKILMNIREELRQELDKDNQIAVRAGFTDGLANDLGFTNHIKGSQFSGEVYTAEQLNESESYNRVADFNQYKHRQPKPTIDLRQFCRGKDFNDRGASDHKDENDMPCRRISIDADKPAADVLIYRSKIVCKEPLPDSMNVVAELMIKAQKQEVLITGEPEDVKRLAAVCKEKGLVPHVLHAGKPMKFDDFIKLPQKPNPGMFKPPHQLTNMGKVSAGPTPQPESDAKPDIQQENTTTSRHGL